MMAMSMLLFFCTDHLKPEADATDTPNGGKEGENGENSVPTSQKSTRSRYMTPTVSAKAKARTSPKIRVEGEESPAKQQKRLSFGSPSVGRANSISLKSKSSQVLNTELLKLVYFVSRITVTLSDCDLRWMAIKLVT